MLGSKAVAVTTAITTAVAAAGAAACVTSASAVESGSVVRLSSGSAVQLLAGDHVWAPDAYYVGGQPRAAARPVAGTDVPRLFETSRDGLSAYNIPVTNGSYTVTLKMAETYWKSTRKRLFDVSIERSRVLTGFDVLGAAGGPDRAVARTFAVVVRDGRLDIGFARVRDVPTISAVEVLPVVNVPVVSPTAPPAGPVWADEFAGPAGVLPDSSKWTHDWGGLGWGDGELQEYTDRRVENSATDGIGNLRLSARREALGNPWSNGAQYTSARITTSGRYSFKYGRLEVRAKVPRGRGIWPAAWLLGTDVGTVGWPASGELDVFELINDATSVYTHAHGATLTGGHWSVGAELSRPTSWSEGFHVYAMDWRSDRIAFFVDDVLVGEVRKSALPAGAVWAFDKPFYILLDIAVGGSWPGPPDASTPMPADMLVDYVRVYA